MPPAPDGLAVHTERQPGLQPWVEVVYALPDKQRVVRVPLPACGLTAAEALDQAAAAADEEMARLGYGQ